MAHSEITLKSTILSLLLTVVPLIYAEDHWKYQCQVNVGCNLSLNYGNSQTFPGIKIFGGISVNSIYDRNGLLNYSASLGFYVKSLGNNLNPLINDIQIDFTHTFIGGYYWGATTEYTKYFRTLNNVPFNNVFTTRDGLGYLGTIFVFNNHKRHQSIGCIGATIKNVSLNYSNDGTPFEKLGLGDAFDRYWTGHGGIYFHSKYDYNYAEVGFDQFTGYAPLLYELSNIIGINVPDYNINYRKESSDSTGRANQYNSSTYNVRINFDQNFGMDIGCIGSLKTNHDRYFGIQELIHMSRNMALHPNNDINRFYFGPNYRYTTYVQ